MAPMDAPASLFLGRLSPVPGANRTEPRSNSGRDLEECGDNDNAKSGLLVPKDTSSHRLAAAAVVDFFQAACPCCFVPWKIAY